VAFDSDIVWQLRVDRQDADGISLVSCAGRVSSLTCPDLDRALAAAVDSAARGVVLDLAAVDYINSAGLRAVEAASARLTAGARTFVVCGLTEAVSVAFALAGLAESVFIEPSRDAALARIRS
jgi:anti-anti-sigma factor